MRGIRRIRETREIRRMRKIKRINEKFFTPSLPHSLTPSLSHLI
jgi:hypothetical protein